MLNPSRILTRSHQPSRGRVADPVCSAKGPDLDGSPSRPSGDAGATPVLSVVVADHLSLTFHESRI